MNLASGLNRFKPTMAENSPLTSFSPFVKNMGLEENYRVLKHRSKWRAERKIRHLTETCKSWLHAKNLPRALWAKGMKYEAYVINRMPLSPIIMKSPYELVFGEKPSVKYLRIFGSICYIHVP